MVLVVQVRREYIRFAIGLTLGLCIAMLAAVNALLVWVATGPRSLEKFTPMIERAFNAQNSHYTVDIGQTWLIWDGWKHPIDIRLRDVSVLTGDGQVFSTFPEIAIGIHLPSMMLGNILPTSLSIEHPIISLFQNDDHSISFGFKQNAESNIAAAPTVPFAVLMAPILNEDRSSTLRKLRYIRIRNADVSVGSISKGVFFEASGVDFIAKRNRRGAIEFLSHGKILYDDYHSTVSSHFVLDKQRVSLDGTFEFSGVEPGTLAKLFIDPNAVVPVHLPISGSGAAALDMEGNVHRLEFKIEGGQGRIEHAALTAPLSINWLHAEGQVDNNARHVQVNSLTADVEGVALAAKGLIAISDGDVAIRVDGGVKNVPTDKIVTLWPITLAPLTREWVTANITKGVVSEATIHTDIQFGDLKKPVLPKEAIDASIALEGAYIRYLPEHPNVTEVKSQIHIDGQALDATVESAQFMKDTKMSKGRVLIEDLNLDNPYIKVNFDAETSARDVVHFLALPRLKHAEHLNLKEDGAEGVAKGAVALGFYFFAPRDINGRPMGDPDVDYQITGEVAGLSHAGFMKRFDIKNTSGQITIDNKKFAFKGKGEVNGVGVSDADITYLFSPDHEGYDTFIDVKANAPKESLPKFGYPNFEFLKGVLGVEAKVKLGETSEISTASIDLTNAAIDAKAISWKKDDKAPATLDITVEKKDGLTHVSAFDLKAKDIEAKGAIDFNRDLTEFSRVAMEKLSLGNTQLTTLNFESLSGGFKLTASGKSADLSGFLSSRNASENTFSFQQFPAVQFSGNIEKLIMVGGRVISNFKGEIACDVRICERANITGVIGEQPFDFRILRNPKGKRQLSLHAQNAGEFLKAFDIYTKMEGGDLTITGNYDDTSSGSILRARMDINEHTIKKAPVLAKILALASLTGFIDTLEGNGIRFNKMVIPFVLQNDVITLTKARAYGNAIGITADGTMVFPKVVFDIHGTVVPSYAANTIVGKLPIIGDILTGGEGKGVFAGNYNVKGTYDNPDVNVNPLSILTPGFLRGIFDAGNK